MMKILYLKYHNHLDTALWHYCLYPGIMLSRLHGDEIHIDSKLPIGNIAIPGFKRVSATQINQFRH